MRNSNIPREAGWAVLRGGIAIAVMILTSLVSACSHGSDLVGLSGRPYNYDDRSIAAVQVNGHRVGGGMDAAQPGYARSGGQSCCLRLPRYATHADVVIQYADGEDLELVAEVEQPWPPMTSLAIVHVLPGPKVMIEITPGQGFARRDLMLAALHELGIEPEANEEGLFREGPFEYMKD